MNSNEHKGLRSTSLLILALVTIMLGCENSFEPLKENDQYYFSIFGTLDASTDTQWVRVMPVRKSIFTSPKPLNARVTITEKRTGSVTVMQDSLFALRDGYYAWIYWTTADIKTGEDYLFEATNEEGETSTVDVFVPEDFPTPPVDYDEGDPVAQIYVDGVERLVIADIIFYFRTVSQSGISPLYHQAISQMGDVRIESDGTQVVYGYPGQGKGIINESYGTDRISVMHEWQEVRVISGGPGWPEVGDLSEEERFLPGAISNVNKGLGVLAGIVSKRVPLESCYDDEGNLEACPLLEPRTVIDVRQ